MKNPAKLLDFTLSEEMLVSVRYLFSSSNNSSAADSDRCAKRSRSLLNPERMRLPLVTWAPNSSLTVALITSDRFLSFS